MTFTIFTDDEETIITGNAVRDDGTAYAQGDISAIRILRRGPRNDPTIYPEENASWVTPGTGNEFSGTIPGKLDKEGYWEFQVKYVLVSTTKPVHSKIIRKYVGGTIVHS